MPAITTPKVAAADEVKVLRDTWSGANDSSLAESSGVEKIAVERTNGVQEREVVNASQDKTPAAVARSAREDFIVAIQNFWLFNDDA